MIDSDSVLPYGKVRNIELSDLLIAHSSKFYGCNCVLTFDKRASIFGLFELLK